MKLKKTIENIKKRANTFNGSPFHNEHYLINIIEKVHEIVDKKRQFEFIHGHTNTYDCTAGYIYMPYIPIYETSITGTNNNFTIRTTTSSDCQILSSIYYNQVNNSYYGTITLTSTSNTDSLND